MSWRRRKKLLLALIMVGTVISGGLLLKAEAATPQLTTKIEMSAPLQFYNKEKVIYDYEVDQVSIRRVLRDLASMSGINVLIDEQVGGNVTLSFNDVTVEEAYEYLRNIAGLYYVSKGDNLLLVSTKDVAEEKGLTKNVSKLMPIRYVNAKLIAALLNNTLFASAGGAETGAGKKATAEFRTNSIILVGTDNDLRLAEDIISKIDIPRESKVFRINHAEAVEVAQLLQATVFNDGITPFDGTGAAGESSIPAQPSSVSVNVETYEEGSGAATEVQGASGSSGGGQQQTFTLRTKITETKNVKIAPDGPIIVPDSRTNTLTIMGTVEQIALAESLVPTLDQKLPQVAIETSLVEILEDGLRELQPTLAFSSGQFAYGFNNRAVTASESQQPSAGQPAIPFRPPEGFIRQDKYNEQTGQVETEFIQPGLLHNIIGLPTVQDQGREGNELAWTTKPIENSSQFLVQLNGLISNRKAKLLANPTVIAVHNSEAVVSVTEEIVRSTQVTRDATGFTQTQVEIGEAGIILNILPKVTGDGYVSLRIRPSVSTIAKQITDVQQNTISLLNRRDLAVQEVRIANGQTLALGGLIEEREVSSFAKVPGLGDLPIIGSLFRTHGKTMVRNELVMLVTPRIMEDSYPLSPASRISAIMNNPKIRAMMGNTNPRLNK
jgi:type II secretory pathway component GspD/PulD (secretin)